MKKPIHLRIVPASRIILFGSLLLIAVVSIQGNREGVGATDSEYDEYSEMSSKIGNALQMSSPVVENKRGGARPFAVGSLGSGEKRGGGRAFSPYAIDEKRGGARSFGSSWKRGGGRYFSYFGNDGTNGGEGWTVPKRSGGRGFQFRQQMKRGGARSFVGRIGLAGAFDGGSGLDIVPSYSKAEQMYVAKANDDKSDPIANRYFYQNNHNFDGLKRAGASRTFIWPWVSNYGRPISRGSFSFEE